MVLGAWVCGEALRIAIIAALPGELKQLVKTGFRRVPCAQRHARKWVMTMGEDEWVAVCAGMGTEAARRAFAEAEAGGKIEMVLSVGWAGALVESLIPGGVYLASAVVDARTGERFELADGLRDEVLVTSAEVAREAEKRRLAETYGAKLVDMESAVIVRMAQMREIPVACFKAVSDGLGERLPDFNAYVDGEGQMRLVAFVAHVLVRPRYWRALMRLGKASEVGAHSLASQIFTFLTGPKDVGQVNRTGKVDW